MYKTRAQQIRAIESQVKAGEISLRRALRDVAECGVYEERWRIIAILEKHFARELDVTTALICSASELEVLGYARAKAERGG